MPSENERERKKGEGWRETGRKDESNKSTRDAILSPTDSSVTASKSEHIRECPGCVPLTRFICRNKQKTEGSVQERLLREEK